MRTAGVPMRRTRWKTRLILAGALAGVAGCTDTTGSVPPPPSRDTSAPFVVAPAANIATAEEPVYVSLPPDSIPGGVTATILDTRTRASVTAAFVSGGFDPVAIPAVVGDTIAVTVQTRGAPLEYLFAVPPVKPPVIVRTDPPPFKRDVPLNASLAIVFSQPIDATTLTSTSVLLRTGSTVVPGQLTFGDGAHTSAQFVPTAPLAGNTDYELVVTQGIRDLSGDVLAAPVSVPFTTGQLTTAGMPLVSVTISPLAATIPVGARTSLTATLKDSLGDVLSGLAVVWSSSDPAIATVSFSGGVAGVAVGTASVTATSNGIVGRATITVTPATVATVLVSPSSASVAVGQGIVLSAAVFDAAGNELSGNNVQWTSSAPAIATVSPTGGVTAIAAGSAAIIALSKGIIGRAIIIVIGSGESAGFASVSAGGDHTCAVTSAGDAYCWGSNGSGEVGDGTNIDRMTPVHVASGMSGISTGGNHTCGVTIAATLKCWGLNDSGQLGDGSTTNRSTPQAVPGIVGSSVAAGRRYTCMIDGTEIGVGHCWGANSNGQLGDGTSIGQTSPVAIEQVPCGVAGGTCPFGAVTAGDAHTCAGASGVNFLSFVWYCWGANSNGELGDGTTTDRPSWGATVGGGMRFGVNGVSAGARHTCGVTPAGAAYCWGLNGNGQLGDGTTAQRTSPVLVAGGFTLVGVSAGGSHTCALTAAGAAYCWGLNDNGQLGDGTTTQRTSPVPVAGGLTFVALSAGGRHTCGVASIGTYCWGANDRGQLGNGTTTSSLVPVKAAGQL